MSEIRCNWSDALGWMTPEHVRDCNDGQCAGCKPCGKSHCGLRSCANHVEQHAGIYTCPSCIGKARRTVRKILDRYADLPEQYEFVGVDSEVLNLHGPAAYPGQWAARKERLVSSYDSRGWCDFPQHTALAIDKHHPYTVLGHWDMAIRESYQQPTDLFVTVSRAVDYLSGDILDTFAHTHEFEEFFKDIRTCLTHLEDTLALSRRPEQGAPCPTCRVELEGSDERASRLLKRYGTDVTGKGDTWHCPRRPEHWWSDVDYRGRVDGDYLEHATALTASQMHAQYDIKPGTLRQWAKRGQVAKRGMNAQGQLTYDVGHARAAALANGEFICNSGRGELRPGA